MFYDADLLKDNVTESVLASSTFALANTLINDNENVLDVGCATGYFGEYLNKVKNCTVVGVDYLDLHIEKAKKRDSYKELMQLNLDTFNDELNKYENYFDKIVILDVLEHLRNPQDSLNKLSKLLKKDGTFLVTVPNVSHQSIKLSLLAEEFEYQDTGLLDGTHIHLFTLKSFKALLNKNKFLIKDFKIKKDEGTEAFNGINLKKIPLNVQTFVRNTPCARHYQYFFAFSPSSISKENLINQNESLIHEIIKKDKDIKVTSNIFIRILIKISCLFIPVKTCRKALRKRL